MVHTLHVRRWVYMRVDIDDRHCGCWSVCLEELMYFLIVTVKKDVNRDDYRKVANRGGGNYRRCTYLAGRSWDSLLGGGYDTGKRKHFKKKA